MFVLLGGSTSKANQPPNLGVPSDQRELVAQLLDRVASLERQLERRGDETERLHQIVAGLAQATAEQARTIRAIEAPQEEAQASETVDEEPEEAETRSATTGPQAEPQSPQRITWRGLRRRILGW